MGQLLRRFSRSSALVLCACCPLSAAPSDIPQPTYRTGVSEVRLVFAASDQNDRALATLNPGDFAVVDRDVIVRKFQSFTRPEFTSLVISILIDSSASMKAHYREEIAQVIELISKTSGVPDESLSLITFQGLQPTVICTRRCHAVEVADVLAANSAQGATPLYDALVFSADALAQKSDPQARKVVLLFSDGNDTVSRNSGSDAIETLLAADVQVYPITISRSNDFLETLAATTGGRMFRLSQGADDVANAVLSDFRSSYQITYKLPDRSSGFHDVHILPTRDMKLHFRCRRGYYYPASR